VPVIVTGKLKISTSRRQVLSDIDLRQTMFRMDCHTTRILPCYIKWTCYIDLFSGPYRQRKWFTFIHHPSTSIFTSIVSNCCCNRISWRIIRLLHTVVSLTVEMQTTTRPTCSWNGTERRFLVTWC